MASGGVRVGAGRPAKVHTKHSPEAADRIRSKIQTESIVQRLTQFIKGEIIMEAAAVSAALGLLKKVLPDLTSVEHTGEIEHNYVARMPAPVKGMDEWQIRYSPNEVLTIAAPTVKQ